MGLKKKDIIKDGVFRWRLIQQKYIPKVFKPADSYRKAALG
jgi:hypothetical protein